MIKLKNAVFVPDCILALELHGGVINVLNQVMATHYIYYNTEDSEGNSISDYESAKADFDRAVIELETHWKDKKLRELQAAYASIDHKGDEG